MINVVTLAAKLCRAFRANKVFKALAVKMDYKALKVFRVRKEFKVLV
jgi:hypothetical protein